MDPDAYVDIVDQILHPQRENAARILEELGLSQPPTREHVHKALEAKILAPEDRLPSHWLPTYQVHWKDPLSIPSLLKASPSPPPTGLTFVRTGLEGRVTGYIETPNPRVTTGVTSTSLERAPGPSTSFVRGKSGHVPFWPGGLDVLLDPDASLDLDTRKKGLRTVPPGFSRGLRLPGEELDDDALLALDELTPTKPSTDEDSTLSDEDDEVGQDPNLSLSPNKNAEIDELLPSTRSHLRPAKAPKRTRAPHLQKRDWAHVIDVNTPLRNFHDLVPDMAHKYPFELDTFQKQAVYHLEMGDSVFVAAHTSAGKTVVAEAIYTSPIKALSNQKFRDFKQTFASNSVGILTGDVQINPEASCLIMTTEILRSMLYKGADLIRDVEFVIFDEVHYVNDAERGVVWEEVIIMLPDHVTIILLSATVPNTKEFADWVGRTKKKDIYVISTAQRPVPLEHYLWAGRDMFKIVDAQRNFLGQGYKDAGEAVRRKQDKEREAAGLPPVQRVGARGGAAQRGQQRGGRGVPTPPRASRGGGSSHRTIHTADKNLYVHLLGHLRKKSLLPVVVFTLSKKRCEENASTLTNADLCTSVEKSEVHVAIEKALSRLKGSDKKLPQIRRMRDLLSRGIGIHHGGLLPIVKEKYCSQEDWSRYSNSLTKGVNMPAKCVVFSNMRKHDGRSFRDILPGEYTQMAGRAGRRGLDPTGTVIIVAGDSLPEQGALQIMMLGKPGKLSSQFRLTYNMILNLLRVEALKVEEMIKRSFSENASQRLLPDQQRKVTENEKILSTMDKLQCDICNADIGIFYDTSRSVVEFNQLLLSMATNSPHGQKVISSGRVVILRDHHFKTNNAAILLKQTPIQASDLGSADKSKKYFVLALFTSTFPEHFRDLSLQGTTPLWPPVPGALAGDNWTYELTSVPLTSICLVTARTVKVDVTTIVDRHLISAMREGVAALASMVRDWSSSGNIPEVEWSKIRSLNFQEVLRSRSAYVQRIQNRSCLLCEKFEEHYSKIHAEKVLRANIEDLKLAISDQNLELIPDYEQRIEVLKDLKFIDANSTVLLKGRVACEINSANELVLTELILENTLAGYEPEEVVALLSCFVFQEKTDIEPVIPARLEEGKAAILAISERIERLQDKHKVPVEDFRKLKFGLVEVVYEWAKGMPFEQITALTDVAEGSIVRVITRLDETCREVRDAARVIGDAELFKKMEESQIKIKRDIVFAASLYF
ncbi:related to SKI2-antiviral protein and putative helicase [Armillaria ostoyae]|uniref:Related to SKI2-antiviral protein and putative helicase n=1 Tax=Armillaria ostoyae TaxID=47428 RepID=A0A284RCC5_ARMOS|nr:related to SKI2-antiviral protein and putative helicase [Armillaria ostoyae]